MERNLKNLLRRLKISKNLKFFSLLIFLSVSTISFIDMFSNLNSNETIIFNILAIVFSIIIGGLLFYMSLIVKVIAYFRARKDNLSLVQDLESSDISKD